MTTTKQTAGNNPFLRRVKRVFNSKVYARTLEMVNLSGESSARDYLATFFNRSISLDAHMDRLIAEMDAAKAVAR
jgi:hypothetical protein